MKCFTGGEGMRPVRFSLFLVLSLLLGEVLVMVSHSLLPPLPVSIQIIIDVMLLGGVCVFFFLFFIFRPLSLQARERYDTLMETVPDIVYRLDREGNFLSISNAVRELGYSPQELLGKHFSTIIAEEDVEEVSRKKVLVRYEGRQTGGQNAPKLFDERRSKERGTKNLEVHLKRKQTSPTGKPDGTQEICIAEINSSGLYGYSYDAVRGSFEGTLGVITPRAGAESGSVGVIRDITQRKILEDMVKVEKARLFSLLDNLPTFLYLLRSDFTITFANALFIKLFGDPEGRKCYEVLGRSQTACKDCPPLQVFTTKTSQTWVWSKAPNKRIYQMHDYPFTDVDGTELVLEMGADITELKLAESELQHNIEKFRGIYDNASIGITIMDRQRHMIDCNPSFCAMLGYEREELLGKPVAQVTCVDDYRLNDAIYQKALEEKLATYSMDQRYLKKDGDILWGSLVSSLIYSTKGELAQAIALVEDITERKEMQEKLLKSIRLLEHAQRIGHLGSWEWRPADNTMAWSQEMYYIFGLPTRKFGTTYQEFLQCAHPEDREMVRGWMANALETAGYCTFDFRIQGSEHDRRIVHCEGEVFADDTGAPVLMVGIIQDITEQKYLIDTIHQKNTMIEIISGLQSRFIVSADLGVFSGKVVSDLCTLTGSGYGFIGDVLFLPDGVPDLRVLAISQRAGSRKAREFKEANQEETMMPHPSPFLWKGVLASAKPLITNNPSADLGVFEVPEGHPPVHSFLGLPFLCRDKVVGIMGIANREGGYDEKMIGLLQPFLMTCANIIESYGNSQLRQKAERELQELNRTLEKRVIEETAKGMVKERLLVQQSKMAAMGEMIGAIAHQWRQPLNAIGVLLLDLKDAYEYGEMDDEYLKSAVERTSLQLSFMSRTIDDFRNFFKPSKEKIVFDVKQSIDDVFLILHTLLSNNNIDMSIQCRPCTLLALGYPNEFKQVMINLINNAKDALLLHNARATSGGGPVGAIQIGLSRQKDNILVTVKDDGGGIPDEMLERIFEPYFTTKEEGKGTGIGLYMSKVIIENNMGGTLTVENKGDGAEFAILLKEVSQCESRTGDEEPDGGGP